MKFTTLFSLTMLTLGAYSSAGHAVVQMYKFHGHNGELMQGVDLNRHNARQLCPEVCQKMAGSNARWTGGWNNNTSGDDGERKCQCDTGGNSDASKSGRFFGSLANTFSFGAIPGPNEVEERQLADGN